MNVPEIVDKINDLYHVLRKTCGSSIEIADTINSILMHGDKVPPNLLFAAWDQFALQRGVKNG